MPVITTFADQIYDSTKDTFEKKINASAAEQSEKNFSHLDSFEIR